MLAFTVANVSVTGAPVVPEPVTSPWKTRISEGIGMSVEVTAVTLPFASTVMRGTCVAFPYVPGLALTVANVRAATPGPVAVPSPERAVM